MRQSCRAHLLRPCREMIEVGGGRAAQFPRAVGTILQSALALRQRRDQHQTDEYGLAVACGQLESHMDHLLAKPRRTPLDQRLANHLRRERDPLFTFLYCPGLEATNWRAEQAIRPMVVTRKVWGGNRTQAGARTQSIRLSVLQTCRQQNLPVGPLLTHLLCSPQPQILNLNHLHLR
jgi:transposase